MLSFFQETEVTVNYKIKWYSKPVQKEYENKYDWIGTVIH